MIQHSDRYASAVVADSRRQYVRATFDLHAPDMVIDSVTTNSDGELSRKDQITDRGWDLSDQVLGTLEPERWILDGSIDIVPDDGQREGQVGWEGGELSTISGEMPKTGGAYPYVEVSFSDVDILQAVTLQFFASPDNGYPTDLTVSIYGGSAVLYSKHITGNRATSLVLDGFTATSPTRLRLQIAAWSLPGRVARVPRIMLGLYEIWDGSDIQSVDIYTEVTFSGLRIPYSTCALTVDNAGHRFDPYAPNTIFTSIEDRQKISVEYGLQLEDGSVEWLPAGTYFQQSAGWSLRDLTVQWDLIDVIGMLTKRRFVTPSPLPTTVSGWLQAIMGSLGVNFMGDYIVDDDVADLALTSTKAKVQGQLCGNLLRYLCMATNTWPRQDLATGYLRVGKLDQTVGNRITIDNMPSYPEVSANDDVADITFALDDGEVTYTGNNTESEVSISINNPYVHTVEDASKAVVSCMFEYGGRSFAVTSRGNPSSECGDIMAIDTQFGSTLSARLYKQQLALNGGIMQDMPSYMVQSPYDTLYSDKTVLTGSGAWTSPVAGSIKLTIIGGGSGGMGGGGGNMLYGDQFDPDDNAGGMGGDGGKVLVIEVTAAVGQVYDFSCGAGGAGGAGGARGRDGSLGGPGSATTFGGLSSESGKVYPSGVRDIQSGAVYAQRGGDYGAEVSGTYGSGGVGGKMGLNGRYATKKDKEYVAAQSTAGTDGSDGLPGCILIEW